MTTTVAYHRDGYGPARPAVSLYEGPFYRGGTAEDRQDRRMAVLVYLPHAFAESTGTRSGLCRICGFPMADAACADPATRLAVALVANVRRHGSASYPGESYADLAARPDAWCIASPDGMGPHRPDDVTCAECGAGL